MEKEKLNWRRLLITIGLVLLTAGVTGGGVWYFMDQVNQTQKKTLDSMQAQIDKLNETVKEDATQDEKDDSNVIKIKELGIKFTVEADIKDLTYKQVQDSVGFSTEALEGLDSMYCGAAYSPLGSITLSPEAPIVNMDDPNYSPARSESALIKKVGSKYLYYISPQSACSENKSASDMQTNQLTKLKEALYSASLI
ncbi:hypothetical protein HGB13_03820 [bacterium]|nr:hypothetical protein [bacterium]